VLIAGFGSFGSTVGRMLRANGVSTTVLDLDATRVDVLRRMGLKVHYGDASRHDLLVAAGAEHARLLVIALDSPERTLQLVHTAKKHFPQLTIMARAFDWEDAHDLVEAGVTQVYSQSLDTSLRVGVDALCALGFRAYHSHRAARQFLRHDQESLRQLTAERRVSQARYITAARQRIEDLERLLEADRSERAQDADTGWDAESLREDVVRGSAQNRTTAE
jgi:voltage-gated potassium channel Kch